MTRFSEPRKSLIDWVRKQLIVLRAREKKDAIEKAKTVKALAKIDLALAD